MIRAFFLLCLVSAASIVAADDAIRLSTPVDCAIGQDCYILNYVDHDPGPDFSDVTCAQHGYNGHKGTDFTPIKADATVRVLAAAAGKVIATRDGMPDSGYTRENAAEIDKKACGNGLLIDHGNGWRTQYCHLKQGSVIPKSGDTVARHQVLGLIGQSGKAEIPHLHITLTQNGAVVDPFDISPAHDCTIDNAKSVWEDPLPHPAGRLLQIGFDDTLPAYQNVRAGYPGKTDFSQTSNALVLFAFAQASQPGDDVELIISGPTGIVYSAKHPLEKHQILYYKAGGKKRTKPTWPAGRYIGTARILRNGAILSEKSVQATVK